MKKLVLLFWVLAGLASAIEVQCDRTLDGGHAQLYFDSTVPLLTDDNTSLLTKNEFCGVKLDQTACGLDMLTAGNEYQFSFRCDDVYGDLYFTGENGGYAQFRCSGEKVPASYANRVYTGCTVVKSASIIGEKAHYTVDNDPKRTTPLIRSGVVDLLVTRLVTEGVSIPAYEVEATYDFNLGILGHEKGVESRLLEETFFNESFIQDLRKNGTYHSDSFDATHLGYADAKNLSGTIYPHCDKIELTNLKDPGPPPLLKRLMAKLLRVPPADVQDLKVVAHIYPGIPVLSAVKVDVSARYQGQLVKAGGDYWP